MKSDSHRTQELLFSNSGCRPAVANVFRNVLNNLQHIHIKHATIRFFVHQVVVVVAVFIVAVCVCACGCVYVWWVGTLVSG